MRRLFKLAYHSRTLPPIEENSPYSIKYRIGKTARSKVGKLFVFDTPEHLLQFSETLEENVYDLNVFVGLCYR